MTYKRYGEYKDSGVKWIGEIPKEWNVSRLKYENNITRGAILRPVDEPLYYDENGKWTYLNISDVTKCNKYLKKGELKLSKLGSEKSAKIKKGNLILTASATIGVPVLNEIDVCIHDGFIAFTNIKFDRNYLYYFLKNKEIYENMGKSNTQKNIYLDEVKNINVPIPSVFEQRKIGIFLDKKTSEIDKLIEEKEKLIELLKEKREAIITEAVTKGLDKNVKMKDSGIEWIGYVPCKWEKCKIAWAFNTISSGTTPKSTIERYYLDGNINWLLTGDLNDSYIYESSKKITKLAIEDYPTLKVYNENSLVLAMYGATIGKLGITKIKTTTNQACCVMSNPIGIDIKYMFYWFLANRKEIINLSQGGGQPNISQSIVKSLIFYKPTMQEQINIVKFIDEKILEIDDLIKKINIEIEYLKEYKKSLISEVVTGKIDVRNEV